MSILDRQDQPAEPTPAERAARNMIRQAKQTYEVLVGAFNEGAERFWKNPMATPQEIAAELGTDAKEVFELHAKIGAFIATINPEAIVPGSAVVGEFSYNADGSVTVPVVEAPAEE
jgi:hypothetical protein